MTDQPKRPLQFSKPIEKEHAAPQGVTVQFFLKHGALVLWPVPGDPAQFNLGAFVQSIRAAGYFMQTDFYLPQEEIACIGVLQAGQPQVVKVHQQPVHPTRQ